jgi:hypothetical protein
VTQSATPLHSLGFGGRRSLSDAVEGVNFESDGIRSLYLNGAINIAVNMSSNQDGVTVRLRTNF